MLDTTILAFGKYVLAISMKVLFISHEKYFTFMRLDLSRDLKYSTKYALFLE